MKNNIIESKRKTSNGGSSKASVPVVVDDKPVTLAVILRTMSEILLTYEEKKVNSGQMNDNLRKRFPSFNHQEYGYTKFHEFCKGIGFKVVVFNGHPWVCEK